MTELTKFLTLVSKLERGYTKMLNRRFLQAGFNLRREQYELLQVLWEEDSVNQQTIAKRLQKDKDNVTKLLNVLEKRGYARRTVGDDRRNNQVVLSGKGIGSRTTLQAIERQCHIDLLFTLSAHDIKTCTWILQRLTDTLEQDHQ